MGSEDVLQSWADLPSLLACAAVACLDDLHRLLLEGTQGAQGYSPRELFRGRLP